MEPHKREKRTPTVVCRGGPVQTEEDRRDTSPQGLRDLPAPPRAGETQSEGKSKSRAAKVESQGTLPGPERPED